MKNSIDADTKSTPFPKEQLLKDIKEFLEIQSKGLSFTDTYKESMTSQPYFTSSQEQFKDSNWKPDITVGLEDNSYIIFPTGKVGQTVGNAGKEISPIIIKGADNFNTSLGIHTQNIINQSLPKLENAYYSSKVFVNTPENIIKGMMGVDILGGAILPDPPVNISQSIGYTIKKYIIDKDFSSPFENPNK